MSCPGRQRHWFTVYGCPGVRRPYCACGAPNPKPLDIEEWHTLAMVSPRLVIGAVERGMDVPPNAVDRATRRLATA